MRSSTIAAAASGYSASGD